MEVCVPTAGVGGIDVLVDAEGRVARCDRGMAAGAAYGSDR